MCLSVLLLSSHFERLVLLDYNIVYVMYVCTSGLILEEQHVIKIDQMFGLSINVSMRISGPTLMFPS